MYTHESKCKNDKIKGEKKKKKQKSSTPKLVDTIHSFSNVTGYKINLQKSLAFLYTNNEKNEKEYGKTIPL
jgi:hypothetical protein